MVRKKVHQHRGRKLGCQAEKHSFASRKGKPNELPSQALTFYYGEHLARLLGPACCKKKTARLWHGAFLAGSGEGAQHECIVWFIPGEVSADP